MTVWAIGDAQAPAERFFAVATARDLLTDAGELKSDTTLVSIGDHFDFGPSGTPLAEIAADGLRILRWLDKQPAALILFGNHDVARVGELWRMTDEAFARARAQSLPIEALRKERGEDDEEVRALTATFLEAWPDLPTTELVARDYSAFTEEQQALVIDMLLGGRARFAFAGGLDDGRDVLLTHAGVTAEQLQVLGLDERADARSIARAINRFVQERVSRVREAWSRGEPARLDLEPLHSYGRPGEEGGGLLYQRPTHWGRPRAPHRRQWQRKMGRRFSPADLPRGLVQVIGHNRHKKCLHELDGLLDDSARTLRAGELRKLVVGEPPRYGSVELSEPDDAAVVYFIDGSMAQTPPEDYQLLRLAHVYQD